MYLSTLAIKDKAGLLNDFYCRKIFEIETIITHEGYGGATGFKDDIALIKLKTEVNSRAEH